MNKVFIYLIVSLILALCTFAQTNKASENNYFPELSGAYLGQKPPGLTPEHFGAGVIDENDRVMAITFSPDGLECFYTQDLRMNTIMTTKQVDTKWTAPKVADFSGKHFEFEPHITPDGDKMIFGSMRPLPERAKDVDLRQWYIKKTKNGWSSPKPLGEPFIDYPCMYVSVADNGNTYYTNRGIYLSRYIDGQYSAPEKLSDNINSLPAAAHPFIAPDESYIVFDAQLENRNSELFISFKDENNQWGKAIKFGSEFNTGLNELCAFVSRDGKYLFFSRMSPGKGDIYWVDAKVIESMRP